MKKSFVVVMCIGMLGLAGGLPAQEESLTYEQVQQAQDIVAVVGPHGLEFEVADSGESPEFSLRIHDGTSRPLDAHTKFLDGDMRVQTHRCPQGGTARTLVVPRSIKRAAA